jgi:F-type H+-transporting ATPase subunit gamma
LAGLAQLRRHIRSVTNIAQVTRAMQMVAASKMVRAQAQLLSARDYVERAEALLTHLAAEEEGEAEEPLHPLLATRPARFIELLLVTASQGFCGALNHAVIQKASEFILAQSAPVRMVTVGSKALHYAVQSGQHLVAEFAGVGSEHDLEGLGGPIAEVLIGDFESGDADQVHVVFPMFVTALLQRPTVRQLLPIVRQRATAGSAQVQYIYRPERQVLLNDLVPRLVQLQVGLALRESIVSEHAARMVAMRQASQNAGDMLDDLTLRANHARQTSLTRQVLEENAGAEHALLTDS